MRDRRSLHVRFDDGAEFDLPAEYLRVLSPSAEVQGHSPEQRQTVAGKIDVTIAAVDQVGNYAVRLTFSDRHDSGISRGRTCGSSARSGRHSGRVICAIFTPRA